MMWLFVLAVPAAFVFSFVLTRYLATPGSLGFVLDQPNHRSMHTTPTPRSGGFAFVLVLLLASGVSAALGVLSAACTLALGLLAGVSYADDRGGLAVRWRLLAHLLAAAVLVAEFYDVMPGLVPALGATGGAVLAFFATVWLINLYNFMDGMDGFSGGMAVVGFGALAVAGALAGQPYYAGFWATLAASVAGFTGFNFPPARIFMGDVGSAVLGLAVALAALWGLRLGLDWSVPAAVFSPFWVDATLTLAKRAARGDKVWEAHAEHYYQQLVRAGWPKRRVVLGEYALMAVCALAGVVMLLRPDWRLGLALGLAGLYAVLLGLCHSLWLRRAP